ncbi:MAG: 2-hydroxyacid dehydrogenase [Pseudobdellovibrio sp.]|nr:2-hydroxyacid dehydrogenase [Pseudobdellovibrio sp.]
MKIAFYDTHKFEKEAFEKVNVDFGFNINFLDVRLTELTASLAKDADVVCSFVNDKVDESCIAKLKECGVKLIALRSAGFNHVDSIAAKKYEIPVCRVPGYSPNAVAEFAVGLLLSLNRKIHKSYLRVHELNFSIDGLVGFDLNGKTVGVIGAGKIGKVFIKIMRAFGCRVLVNDLYEDPDVKSLSGVSYVSLQELVKMSDVISLHVPLNKSTFHLVNSDFVAKMKPQALLINTGRGALIEARALIEGLKSKKIGGAALDVYEEEEGVFFHDLSSQGLNDDILARLLTFPNVLMTSHQGFLTNEALSNIATTTLESVRQFQSHSPIDDSKLVSS